MAYVAFESGKTRAALAELSAYVTSEVSPNSPGALSEIQGDSHGTSDRVGASATYQQPPVQDTKRTGQPAR
jgi:hypothetical protein